MKENGKVEKDGMLTMILEKNYKKERESYMNILNANKFYIEENIQMAKEMVKGKNFIKGMEIFLMN